MANSEYLRPLALSVVLLPCAFALLWSSPGFSEEPEDVCPGYGGEEATSYATEIALWPPGATKCEYTTPSGAVKHSTYFDWAEWGLLALLAASAVLAILAARRALPPRGRRIYGAALLLFIALALPVIGLLVVFALPPVLIGMALMAAAYARLAAPRQPG